MVGVFEVVKREEGEMNGMVKSAQEVLLSHKKKGGEGEIKDV